MRHISRVKVISLFLLLTPIALGGGTYPLFPTSPRAVRCPDHPCDRACPRVNGSRRHIRGGHRERNGTDTDHER